MPEMGGIRSGTRTEWAAAVTLVIGLIFIAAGAEALAAFNACVADPACLPDAFALNVGAFFAILAVGIAMAVVGARILAIGRTSCQTDSR